MADILPIKAWRYNPELGEHIEELTSPLFDVVSPKQLEALYKNEFNSIHLSVPKGEDPALEARETLETWKREGVILQDKLPGLYVYYQYFTLSGDPKEYCRKGFICHVKAYDWEERVVLRHENTIPRAVNDRIDLLKATAIQASPTHGLYHDPDLSLEHYMDEAISSPLYDIEDYQGVREVLGVIHDARIIRKFCRLIKEKKIILADGHHRYEGAIGFRNLNKASNPQHHEQLGYNYHMMYLSNSASDTLKILPTHRLFQHIQVKEEVLLQRLSEYFTIKDVSDPEEIGDLIINKPWAFGLVFKDSAYKIRLKPEMMDQRNDGLPALIKHLDLEVLHYFFIEKVLGIPREAQRLSPNISYERNLSRCHSKVITGEVDFAVITKGLSMKEVMEVAESGYMMPQKSTYFYPKAISGLIFASINEDEFKFPYEMFL